MNGKPCMETGAQVLDTRRDANGKVLCGCCGKRVRVVVAAGDPNQIPRYGFHRGAS